MTELAPWPDTAAMDEMRRDQTLLALAQTLSGISYGIRVREESFIRRNGGKWDATAERDYRALESAVALIEEFHAGARGVAIDIAKKEKSAGREVRRMPEWMLRCADVARVVFCRPLPKPVSEETKLAETETDLANVS